ncbi:tRNA (uridine(54)-C5)-methyltransferase TrmA [Candidatus Palibaumannia cicadellinicola]|uniref:tRNA/tmRNA (uracil-C(5))-methyltransferase n=1 Tax=Candidatus Palibaumannia cicadellinicola TaxID=186490 RepID=A0A088MXN1_9GAMM|nr:tRNA (uridine(54)-C5)-methyltransferase TrmA [Candidatus Baumannia cicadellinicola]AIN47062.1 tRNA (uracil(54)-C5)-methyltransferase [Candidatus Baumannia cicadellinicola]
MTPETLFIEDYERQLKEKARYLQQIMAQFHAPYVKIFDSQPINYRMRAEFRVWHDYDNIFHIMFDPQTKKHIPIDHFMAGSLLMNELMSAMIAAVRSSRVLRNKLFQLDYLTTLSGEAVITLIYHQSPEEKEWRKHATQLREDLRAKGYQVNLISRAAKQKICIECNYAEEFLPVSGRILNYRQIENSFTQPNAGINIKMLEWALEATQESRGDLLELYCGNGNFSLALACNFERILATEIAKPSVEAAQHNLIANKIENVQIIRMSATEFTQAIQGKREFTRMRNIDLHSYQCETIFVNPPRSGLDEVTTKMVQAYPRIIYISCNPKSLCHNLSMLAASHTIELLALFDQFPYTNHIECGLLLVRKAKYTKY